MKIVRVTPGGWSHRYYVAPKNWLEKLILLRRGYRAAPDWLGYRGWMSHPKAKFKY